MAYLEDEPAGEKVADMIADALDDGTPILMTVVNAGEVWYIVARRTTAAEADRTIKLLEEIGIEFINADWLLTKIAAGYKVNGNISFADCYAAALAKVGTGSGSDRVSSVLVTGDREFKQLEKEITITWL